MTESRIIVALDGKSYEESWEIVDQLKDAVWGFKINDLFLNRDPDGLEIVNRIGRVARVMLDLKLYDIPNTVANQTKRLMSEPVDILTVHASGGVRMVAAAVANMPETIAVVTCLTSLDKDECLVSYARSPEHVVTDLAKVAHDAKAPYLVCSPKELSLSCFNPKFKWAYLGKKIVPGIRPAWYQTADDQRRVMTPADAIKAGADLVVIGRPILKADDRLHAVTETNVEISGAIVPESA